MSSPTSPTSCSGPTTSHAVTAIVDDRGYARVPAALGRLWGRCGVPRRIHLDRGGPFTAPTGLGKFVGSACTGRHTGVHPDSRAMAQRHHGALQRHLRPALLAPRTLRGPGPGQRTSKQVRTLHNAQHRYRATGRSAPHETPPSVAASRSRSPRDSCRLARPRTGRLSKRLAFTIMEPPYGAGQADPVESITDARITRERSVLASSAKGRALGGAGVTPGPIGDGSRWRRRQGRGSGRGGAVVAAREGSGRSGVARGVGASEPKISVSVLPASSARTPRARSSRA
jgi:hypothetical protein